MSTHIPFFVVGWMEHEPGAAEARWAGHIEYLKKRYSPYQDAVELDEEAIELEWKILPGFTTLTILQEIQEDLEEKNI